MLSHIPLLLSSWPQVGFVCLLPELQLSLDFAIKTICINLRTALKLCDVAYKWQTLKILSKTRVCLLRYINSTGSLLVTRHKSDNEEESCSYTSTWATLIVSGCIWRGVLQKDVYPGMCPLSYHKLWKSPRTPGWCIKWGLALMGAFTTFTIDRI